MSRPPEPEFLKQWRAWVRSGPPRCCHTCEHYDRKGACVAYEMTPPVEFASTVDACPSWLWEIPF